MIEEPVTKSPVVSDLPTKLSMAELKTMLREAKRAIPAHTAWRHYGGTLWWVIGHTIDKNANYLRVVYVPIDQRGQPDQVPFDCPLTEWQEPLETERFKGERFTRIDDEPTPAQGS